MNPDYWPKYYKDHKLMPPSQFVTLCLNKIKNGDNILDVGAGDGRDSVVLAIASKNTVVAIEPNASLHNLDGVQQITSSFERYVTLTHPMPKPDVVYARWFIHAVTEHVEKLLIEHAATHEATLMLEFRIEGDTPDDTHDRRLINPYKLVQQLVERGYIITHFEIGTGLSVHGTDDPYLARIIAEHKRR